MGAAGKVWGGLPGCGTGMSIERTFLLGGVCVGDKSRGMEVRRFLRL